MKALKTALDKLAEEGAGFAEEMGHGLLDAFLAVDLLGRYHVRLEAIDAGWQAPPEPVEFSEIATEAMTPEAAIEFFRTKTTMIKVPDFVQLAEKYRQRAFTIAWVEEIELLEASKGLLESFVADDRGLEAFRTELGSMFDRAGVTRLADWHLETVYRTNMQTAYNAGRWDELMDPEMIEFFPLIEYHAVLDDRTRPTHRAMHGTRLPRDDPWWEINWPPNGYSCFLPGTLVSGRFVAGLKSRYSGPAREIVTRQGNRLRVTPNHPVMTAQGLIPACELRKGDCLLSYHPHVESESSILGDIDHQDGPMLIEDVFKSLAMNRAVALRVATDLDLHGDAIWTDRNVYVVGTNRVLTTGIESGASENVNNFRFVPSSTGESGIHSFGHLNFFLEGSLSSYGSFPRRSALAGDNLTVIRRPFADIPLDPLCISPAANWHIMLSENAKECPSGDSQVFREFFEALPALVSANDLTDVRELYFVCSDMDTPFPQETIERVGAYAQFISDLFEASAGEITLDDIISIREFYFSGHVYDLQSEYGWILAQNIFTSNCRCTPIPVSELDNLEAQSPPATTTDDQGRSVAVTADPGFAHNPGTRAGWENTEREIAAKAMDNGIVVRETPDGSFRPERVLTGMRSERVQRLSIPGPIEE